MTEGLLLINVRRTCSLSRCRTGSSAGDFSPGAGVPPRSWCTVCAYAAIFAASADEAAFLGLDAMSAQIRRWNAGEAAQGKNIVNSESLRPSMGGVDGRQQSICSG